MVYLSSFILFTFFNLIKRKFLINHDTDENKKKAYEWASENSISYSEALKKLDIIGEQKGLDDDLLAEACNLELKSTVKMGVRRILIYYMIV